MLVTGASGMLGRALVPELRRAGFAVTPADLPEFDITDGHACRDAVSGGNFEAVVNVAAITDVDGCETRRDQAFAVNAAGVENLARAVAGTSARLLHFSTDYVFDGAGSAPLCEEAPANPLNVYGLSKLEGERALARALAGSPERGLVLRVCSLYGRAGRNFVDTIAGRLRAGEAVNVVDDQVTRPTPATDLAEEVALLLAGGPALSGTYHLASGGACSWCEFARRIAQRLGLDAQARVRPVSSAQFPRPARRPPHAVLDTGRYEAATGRRLPSWQEGLDAYLAGGAS